MLYAFAFFLPFMMANSRSKAYRQRPFTTSPPNPLEFVFISLKQYKSKHLSTTSKRLVFLKGYIFIIKVTILLFAKNRLHVFPQALRKEGRDKNLIKTP